MCSPVRCHPTPVQPHAIVSKERARGLPLGRGVNRAGHLSIAREACRSLMSVLEGKRDEGRSKVILLVATATIIEGTRTEIHGYKACITQVL
jgi:hypothetical protein